MVIAAQASAADGIRVLFSSDSSWWGGFSGSVKISNTGQSAMNGWSLQWSGGPAIESAWNTKLSSTATPRTATNESWNGIIPAGGSVVFGFTASGALETNVVSCTVNGSTAIVDYNGAVVVVPPPPPPVEPPPAPVDPVEPPPVDSPVSAPTSGINVSSTVDSSWGSGYTATLTITNNTAAAVDGWSLAWEGGPSISSLWNGVLSSSGGTTTIKDAGWNKSIAVGASVTVGFTGTGSFDHASFIALRLNGIAVGAGGGATGSDPLVPVDPIDPVDPVTPITPIDPVVPASGSWPATFFAPYVDVTLWPPPHLPTLMASTGARYFTGAFIVARQGSACDGAWGGYEPYTPEQGFLKDQLAELRALGGDVMVSFGGAAGTELAAACATAESLAAAYQEIINAYQFTHIDFDIEGIWVAQPASITRRSQAIRLLQESAAAAGRELHVWYTLPVLPQGLTHDGIAVVRAALEWGVNLEGINLMAMDYGANAAPPQSATMGQYAIRAAESVHSQLASVYSAAGQGRTTQQLWSMIGLTPMIGQNDVAGEVFTLSDAALVRDFAASRGLGMLSMWSVTRDQSCPGGPSQWASATCSGIVQDAGEFSAVLGAGTP